ncbi:MAG TPA: hypothetical protein VII30_10415 [Gemmatimonadaceae bacterium]
MKRRRDKARHVSHAGLGGTREEIEQTRLAIRCDVTTGATSAPFQT